MEVKVMSVERAARTVNGWAMLVVDIGLYAGSTALYILAFTEATVNAAGKMQPVWQLLVAGSVVLFLAILGSIGFFALQPNEARVLVLGGNYKGTSREIGFRWGNPFFSNGTVAGTGGKGARELLGKKKSQSKPGTQGRFKVSLRARTLNGDKLKVNDKRGNPVEIAAVVVWRVEDTAKAAFDVDDFESYVHIQSESALRHIASLYAYDRGEEHEPTLRESADEVAVSMKKELQERLDKAGVVIEEARLTHLAYAPEIAQAMLRRQQAEAVIAARQKIVHGAVSMVEMALRELSEKQVVKLDEERKASMVSNLLVVLCGEAEVTPVVNTGTLYSSMPNEERKPFLLRIPPDLWKELEKWAGDELRSVNGQIEYLLRQAVDKRKRTAAEEK
jgi:regulator of protease activity HflC (stomatin/prohibitin superfamily)